MPRPAKDRRRFLLDENMDPDLVPVLQGLGHTADHVTALGLEGRRDQELVSTAKEYDVFVTLDLHRQESEFIAVNEALVRGDIKVLRIRLPREEQDLRLDLATSLVIRMREWLHAFGSENKALVTIRSLGTVQSARTRAEVLEMLEQRRG